MCWGDTTMRKSWTQRSSSSFDNKYGPTRRLRVPKSIFVSVGTVRVHKMETALHIEQQKKTITNHNTHIDHLMKQKMGQRYVFRDNEKSYGDSTVT